MSHFHFSTSLDFLFAQYPFNDSRYFWLCIGRELLLAESQVVPGGECSVEIDQVAVVTPRAQVVA